MFQVVDESYLAFKNEQRKIQMSHWLDYFYLITLSGTSARLLAYPREVRDNHNGKLLPDMELPDHRRMFKAIHVKSKNERVYNISL